jgi:Fe-S cluster biogenesis protein NfuA
MVGLDPGQGACAARVARADLGYEKGMPDAPAELLQIPELEARVRAVLDEVRPMLQSDGGDIALVGITTELKVRVQMIGACRSCPSQANTLHSGIENYLREQVPEVQGIEVEAAPQKIGQGGYWGVY